MGLDIVTNTMATEASNDISTNQMNMQSSLEKLSSGYQINSPADDASGYVISQHLQSQIGGFQQAQANTQSAINVVQTADGALNEVEHDPAAHQHPGSAVGQHQRHRPDGPASGPGRGCAGTRLPSRTSLRPPFTATTNCSSTARQHGRLHVPGWQRQHQQQPGDLLGHGFEPRQPRARAELANPSRRQPQHRKCCRQRLGRPRYIRPQPQPGPR